ncbi:MAG TPA: potassium channel protein [Acidimicrobiales bacterium]|nr:potassium channel protein [Acidimicrobiales bacterium]
MRDRRRAPRPSLRWLVRGGGPWHRFEVALVVVLGVLAFGTVGYVVVGLGPFDALYQTAITLSTVGYGEIGPDHEVDGAYRAFTLVLVLVAASSLIYTASVLFETLVEGTLDDRFRRRRMQREVDRLRDHVIVAGWGRVGRSIAGYARRHGLHVVALDQDGSLVVDDDVPVVVGDATDEDTLRAAGIDRAASLIAALGDDSDNLALVLTARSMREDLLIVARIANERDGRKFARAGADRVVNPYEIGGSRMAAIAFRPHVAEFLDEVVHSDEHDVDIHEVRVPAGSPAVGAELGTVCDAAVIAVKAPDGSYAFTPPRDRRLARGDVLIAVGSADQLRALATTVGGTPA